MNPVDLLGPVIRHRRSLERARAALARGQLTVGFLGGSITDPSTGNRWPEPVLAWLAATYPGLRLTAENAALGATGSDLAAIRTQSAILDRGCDLVFVEYAVNDFGTEPGRRARTREGLLRQLLVPDGCDVVIVYTYGPDMQADMLAGKAPASIADFELLAEHYGLTSIWVGLHALREVQQGLMTWEDWLPDGLHPEARGSLSYAQAVMAFLGEAFAAPGQLPNASRRVLPPALMAGAWARVTLLSWAEVNWTGPWSLQRWHTCRGLDQILLATGPGARLSLRFSGRGLVLGFDFGRHSGEIRYRVDGGDWESTRRDCPAWAGTAGWLRPVVISDELASGPHAFELETLPGAVAENRGTRTAIGFFAVIG